MARLFRSLPNRNSCRSVVFSGRAVAGGDNPPVLQPAWLLARVPLPEARQGPGFLCLWSGKRPTPLRGTPFYAVSGRSGDSPNAKGNFEFERRVRFPTARPPPMFSPSLARFRLNRKIDGCFCRVLVVLCRCFSGLLVITSTPICHPPRQIAVEFTAPRASGVGLFFGDCEPNRTPPIHGGGRPPGRGPLKIGAVPADELDRSALDGGNCIRTAPVGCLECGARRWAERGRRAVDGPTFGCEQGDGCEQYGSGAHGLIFHFYVAHPPEMARSADLPVAQT
jgi:hypothetical protein